MKEVSVEELKSMMDNNENFKLIDVRESFEYDLVNIGGELIPLGEIVNKSDAINPDEKTVIHCKSGARSAAAIKQLETTYGFSNLYNLKGGIIAWVKVVDPSLPVY